MTNDDDDSVGKVVPGSGYHSAKSLHENRRDVGVDPGYHSAKSMYEKSREDEAEKHFGVGKVVLSPVNAEGHATVTSVRDVALSFEPTLAEDLDHIIAQLRDQSEPYLRAIASDPEGTCEGIGLQTGELGWVTVGELARGELQDRHSDAQKGTEWWKIVVTTVLTVVGTLIVVATTGAQ